MKYLLSWKNCIIHNGPGWQSRKVAAFTSPSVRKRVCLVCFCVHSYAGPRRWDRTTEEKGCSVEKETRSLFGPSRN